MTTNNTLPPSCVYCGHPLLLNARCDACDGWRGDWCVTEEGEWLWEPCANCEGSGTLDVCICIECSLDGKDHLMLVNQRPHQRQQGESAS